MRVHRSHRQRYKGLFAKFLVVSAALISIVSCAETELATVVTEESITPAVRTTPKSVDAVVSPEATALPPTSAPVATLAQPEVESDEVVARTPAVDETASPGDSRRGVLPDPTSTTYLTAVPPTSVSPSASPTPSPVPQPANPSPTSTLTHAPTANSVPTPLPTVAPTPTAVPTLAPTPRPTPGPISRQTQFVPLDEPAYVSRDQASANIKNASYVLGVANNGEARAYPLDMMWYHHIANDTIGGEPWLVTY